MSENVEVLRRAIDAFNRRDFEAFSRIWTTDAEVDFSRSIGPMQGVYGHGQMRRFWDDIHEPWESVRIELDQVTEVEDRLVTPQTTYVRGRDGIEVSNRVTQVWTIREGLIAGCCMYQDEREARQALGLPEQGATE